MLSIIDSAIICLLRTLLQRQHTRSESCIFCTVITAQLKSGHISYCTVLQIRKLTFVYYMTGQKLLFVLYNRSDCSFLYCNACHNVEMFVLRVRYRQVTKLTVLYAVPLLYQPSQTKTKRDAGPKYLCDGKFRHPQRSDH
jgi:hypothetical protein